MSANDPTAPSEFRTIPWLDGYRFGDDGSAWSRVYTGEWRRLNPPRRKNGHYRFDVYIDGARRGVALHELACEAWHGPRPSGTECVFKDGSRDNLAAGNLAWGVLPENRMDPAVEYRPISCCDGYLFGSDGSAWTCWRTSRREKTDTWRRLAPAPQPSGHLRVCIRIDGKQTVVDLHRMVCWAFHGPCPEGMECCHFPDRDPTNNRPDNLRWDTHLENVRDQLRHGTKARGERHGSAALNDPKVQEIRLNAHLGPRALSRIYGVAHGTIRQILIGETWTHLPWPEGTAPQTEKKPRGRRPGVLAVTSPEGGVL